MRISNLHFPSSNLLTVFIIIKRTRYYHPGPKKKKHLRKFVKNLAKPRALLLELPIRQRALFLLYPGILPPVKIKVLLPRDGVLLWSLILHPINDYMRQNN